MQLVNGLNFKNLRGDLFGGITAAVVALPLALAFGVSSGAGAIAGLYGAVIVGFFAALFGGTPSQISGPTGPMTVVMATVFSGIVAANPENGIPMAFTVVMLGGIFQILFGVMRLGKYITLMPYTVISGFMSGIGLIIILLQIGPFLGHPASANVVQSIGKFPEFIANANPAATSLGILTLVIVFGLPAKFNRLIPSPLLALIVGTLLAFHFLPNTNLRLIGDIPSGLPNLQLPIFNFAQLKTMISYGLMLAVLGSIDSLLTSLVADNITRTQHDSERELIGQGIGNLISGLFGGLPGAGATMRTVINVKTGGKTPISGMVHALVLLIIVLKAGPLTANIPHAVLAGILIKVGIDIIDWSFLKRAHQISLKATGLMYTVMFLTVFVDLITAVAIGVFLANLLTVKNLTDIQINKVKAITNPDDAILTPEEKHIIKQAKGKILLFSLSGPMSFGAAKTISQRMGLVNKYDVLILDLTDVPLIGVTASLAIENMVKDAYEQNRQVILVSNTEKVQKRLQKLKLFRFLSSGHNFSDRLSALQKALTYIDRSHLKSQDTKIANPEH
ncbi:MAG: SulP family inorganic anion transporter [Xenococcaceae cyanobacterium MO_188.B32]|nr:SulP family inorganic anion transporter [Xenococcaceae cyanobacterium MO_188.B32]